jgi:hypothetical protein
MLAPLACQTRSSPRLLLPPSLPRSARRVLRNPLRVPLSFRGCRAWSPFASLAAARAAHHVRSTIQILSGPRLALQTRFAQLATNPFRTRARRLLPGKHERQDLASDSCRSPTAVVLLRRWKSSPPTPGISSSKSSSDLWSRTCWYRPPSPSRRDQAADHDVLLSVRAECPRGLEWLPRSAPGRLLEGRGRDEAVVFSDVLVIPSNNGLAVAAFLPD